MDSVICFFISIRIPHTTFHITFNVTSNFTRCIKNIKKGLAIDESNQGRLSQHTPRIPVTRTSVSHGTAVHRDENGSDTNGYHLYYICFHISVLIRIQIRIAFGYIYEYGLTRLRIRYESDSEMIGYKYLFGY